MVGAAVANSLASGCGYGCDGIVRNDTKSFVLVSKIAGRCVVMIVAGINGRY